MPNKKRCQAKNPSKCSNPRCPEKTFYSNIKNISHIDITKIDINNFLDIKLETESISNNMFTHELSSEVPKDIFLLHENFSKLDKTWHGEIIGQEMYEAGDKNWSQIEWIGWGFEFWAKNNLRHYFQIHDDIDEADRTLLDAHKNFSWDFKTHVTHNANGKPNLLVPLNDKQAIDGVLSKYGQVGFIVAEGSATFGNKFEEWRMKTKGSLSKAQIRNKAEGRPSRKRKDTFTFNHINVYILNNEDFEKLKNDKIITIFKQGKQADGSPRKEKYNFAISKVKPSYKFMV